METFQLAVIGCGAVSQALHLPAIAATPSVRAVALVDRELSRARALADRWGVPVATADLSSVSERIDGAVVALPNHLHAPVSCELLRRGIHVLVEKPMAPTAEACDAMIAAAEQGGAVLAVGHEFRFFASTELVRRLLAEGLIGEVRELDLRQGVVTRWPFASDFVLRRESAGGGVLVDFGVHVLDLLMHWLGDWREVACADDARGGPESDCELALTLASGARGVVEVSRTRSLRNSCRLVGDRGELEVGIWDADPEVTVRLRGAGGGGVEAGLPGWSGRARAEEAGGATTFPGAFQLQLADFVAAAREGREPRVPGREGRRAVALVEACYARRRPLDLPWDEPAELAAWRAAPPAAPRARAGA
jgi:predicted dehydrogenase